MKFNRWVYATAMVGVTAAGGLAEQACSSSSSSTTPKQDAGGSGSGTGSSDSGVAPFGPGDGGACVGPVGSFPDPSCDPSDEQAAYCTTPFDAGGQCHFSPKCGNTSTCEPFVKNPAPGTGVDNFRMRLINLTAPASLVSLQGLVVTSAVDLPSSLDGGAPCGESGTGLFNWLISVDKKNGKVTTGGAPPSSDPFGLGYCFLNTTLAGQPIAPVQLTATFTGNTFSTSNSTGVLNIPIFVQDGNMITPVLLPINNASLHDVTVSSDGDCIGQINTFATDPTQGCVDPKPAGQGSCSRWHSAGTLGGYITLAQADAVPVVSLGGESLCYLLTGSDNGATPKKCATTTSGGDYDSKTLKATAAGAGDSVWLSAQFAASAVNITPGEGVPLCAGNGSGSGSSTGSGSGASDSGVADSATSG